MREEFPESSFVKAKLIQKPLYREDGELWDVLTRHADDITHFFRQIGQELVFNHDDGYAFIRQMRGEADEKIPKVVQRRALGYEVTLLLVCLREEYLRMEISATDSNRIVKTREEIVGLVTTYLEPHPDFYPDRYRSLLDELQETKELTVTNIDDVEDAVIERVRDRIKEQDGIISSNSRRILPLMQTFLSSYPAETSDLRADIDYAKDFVQLRDQLETEKLPQYRDRFRSFLDENLLSSLANFRAKLEEDENNIRKRIIKVNEALKNIQFSESTYVEIRDSRAHNEEITIFRRRLAECFEGTLGDSDEAREVVLEKDQAPHGRFRQTRRLEAARH